MAVLKGIIASYQVGKEKEMDRYSATTEVG